MKVLWRRFDNWLGNSKQTRTAFTGIAEGALGGPSHTAVDLCHNLDNPTHPHPIPRQIYTILTTQMQHLHACARRFR
jgi:hypothetical protein